MLKSILQLNGIQTLNKKQQLTINGGKKECITATSGGLCTEYGLQCAELICQIGPI